MDINMIPPANEKYIARAKALSTAVCIGLDADFAKIPDRFKSNAHPQFTFNQWIIDETHAYAAAFKINSAFYEARGAAGIEELKLTFDYIREKHPDVFTILDAKRADIGNTNLGYVEFAYDWLGADALTLHPYLGREALQPFLDRADKVSIILCRTSNPGSGEFQNLESAGKPLWASVAEKVSREWDVNHNCMLVVGATYPAEMRRIREIASEMSFLVPGVGTQGGSVAEAVSNGRSSSETGLLINSSRGIIFSENPAADAEKLRLEINTAYAS